MVIFHSYVSLPKGRCLGLFGIPNLFHSTQLASLVFQCVHGSKLLDPNFFMVCSCLFPRSAPVVGPFVWYHMTFSGYSQSGAPKLAISLTFVG